MAPGDASVRPWGSAAALIITALVIFTLAALVTAIITAHVQPGYPGFQPGYSPGFRQVQLAPRIHLLPDVQHIAVQAPGS